MLRRAASGTLASTSRDVLSTLYRRMSSAAFGASTSVHATTTTTTPSIERWSAELMEVRRIECVHATTVMTRV